MRTKCQVRIGVYDVVELIRRRSSRAAFLNQRFELQLRVTRIARLLVPVIRFYKPEQHCAERCAPFILSKAAVCPTSWLDSAHRPHWVDSLVPADLYALALPPQRGRSYSVASYRPQHAP